MTFPKDPDAILDYVIDWTAWLGADTIAASQWIVPSGLTKTAEENSSTTATVWLSGGSAGQRYTVTNRITTAGGRTEDRSISIQVKER